MISPKDVLDKYQKEYQAERKRLIRLIDDDLMTNFDPTKWGLKIFLYDRAAPGDEQEQSPVETIALTDIIDAYKKEGWIVSTGQEWGKHYIEFQLRRNDKPKQGGSILYG